MKQMQRVWLLLISSVFLCAQAGLAQETPIPSPSAPPTATPAPSPSPNASIVPSPTPIPTPSPAPLVVTPAKIATNIGVTQTVTVTGAVGALSAILDPKIAGVSVNGSTIVLAPIRNGTAILHVVDTSGTGTVDIPVRVAPNAGTIAPTLAIKVTGANVDPAFIALQANLALGRATVALPGGVPQIGAITPPGASLDAGGQVVLAVPVTIAGGDQYLDVSGSTQITVQQVAAAPFDPTVLYYSDDPERILNDGVLYRGLITNAQPVRLYDYHENGTQTRRIVLALSPTSTATSTVQTLGYFAGPSGDVMNVGHAVTKNFLIDKAKNQGVIVDLAGNAPFFERDVLMRSRDGVASAIDFKLLSGDAVTLTVLAVSPGVNPALLLDGPVLPGDGKGRTGTYALAGYGTQSLSYAAGGPEVSATIGDREPSVPKVAANEPGKNLGDYGVLFTLHFSLSNPGDVPQTAYLYESPRGGPVRASYQVDTEVVPVELGCATSAGSATASPHRYLIRTFPLAPHTSETHVVRTMTDGGSNFPIIVGVSAAAPEPTTPPIRAPDGCFPKPGYVAPPAITPSPAASALPLPEPTP